MKLLLAIAAAGISVAASPAQKPATVVPVQLYSYGYAPSPIVLRAGSPVTLVFQNVSGKGHSFKAEAFFRSARILAGMPHEGEVHLKPHQSMSVTLVPARGTYPVHCSHFFHDQLGMHTAIYVQ